VAIHEPLSPTRRDFIKGAGGLLVAISLPVYLDVRQAAAATVTPPGSFGPLTVPADRIASWLAIGRDGVVRVLTGKVELGTGTMTASRQIVAEELEVAVGSIELVQGVTGETVDQGYTAGSQTIRTQWATGLRIAAASARQTLLSMAADHLGVATGELSIKNGVVSGGGKMVSYASLVGGQALPGAVSQQVKTKPSSSYTVVGQPLHRHDIPDKIFGRFTYVQDVKLPGMLHARVVRPARPAPLVTRGTAIAQIIQGTLANAALESVDRSSVEHLPGFVQLVVKKDLVAVVAEREEQAVAAAQALKVTWKDSASLPDQASLYSAIQSAPLGNTRVIQNMGDVDGALGSAAKVLEATYMHPYQAHASIGPSASVAYVHDGVAEVWSPTQGVYQLRGAIATALGMQPQLVRVNYVEGSGCYGINGADDASIAAAMIAQQVGKPVRVQYMRADEISWENFGTPMVMNLRAGLDASGRIVGWDYHGWTANRGGRPGPPGSVPSGVLAGFPEQPPPPSPPPSPPLGDDGLNSTPWYAFTNERVISYATYLPWLFTGPLRSPSRLQNTFATESFMDELAASAGADPIAFRLAHTNDPRLAAVINRVASAAGWQPRPSPAPAQGGTKLTGRGIAAVRYEGNSAWVAAIIAVTVDTTSGAVAATMVAIAHDCGVIVNPDGLRNQVEGNIVQGLSRSLKEEVKFDKSGVLGVDWVSYPIISFAELPDDVRIELIDHPELPALGAGESTISVIGGAIGNAIFDATGKRLRTLPFTPDRVKAALAT
jgi:nicotinate dehydrogenase subunit B